MDLLLKANREKLLNTYNENLEAVLALQRLLLTDVLPSLTDELDLDAESEQWATEWLNDTCMYAPARVPPVASPTHPLHFLQGSLFQIMRVREPSLLSARSTGLSYLSAINSQDRLLWSRFERL